MRRKKEEDLSNQMKRRQEKGIVKKEELHGNIEKMLSTGSTLLDLEISGGRVRGGGIPGGVMVEIFGASATGKTVFLSELAGAVQRQKGQVMFHDPEGRLDTQFAKIFGFRLRSKDYKRPNTVTEVFADLQKWEPETSKGVINGIFADSLAALSTNLEMDSEDGDKMGMRRAKEFSEGFRKTARLLANKNFVMICSNQIRETMNSFGPKYKSPGGEAIGFYSSLRLRPSLLKKIYKEIKIAGKIVKKVIGIQIEMEVFKSSIWKPHGKAPVTIIFDYGIDNIRENLQYIKGHTKNTTYAIGETNLGVALDEAVFTIEKAGLEKDLEEEVIDLWEEIEEKFKSNRKKKER